MYASVRDKEDPTDDHMEWELARLTSHLRKAKMLKRPISYE